MAEKTVEVPVVVRDLAGLYFDLKKADFSVRNVGAHQEKTFVYLEDVEEKDPTQIVEEWAKKPKPTRQEMVARAVKFKAELAAQEAKKEALRKAAELAAESGAPMEEPEKKPSFFRRVFKKLW